MATPDTMETIYTYTRAQAIEDGELVDVTPWARETGFRWPVAVTRAVWASCIAVPPRVIGQDERGRAHDVLWMAFCAIRRGPDGRERLYRLHFRNDNRPVSRRHLVTLKLVSGPGDDAEPVLTIMLPQED